MSSPAHASEVGHGHASQDHVPHVLPLKVYFGAWGTLLVLTVLTVAASYFNFGEWNLIIALAIATMKAATVALIFMHLFFDNKFHSIILASSLVFLAVFIGFTMFDTETRGRADAKEHDRAADSRNPFAKATASATAAAIEVPHYSTPVEQGGTVAVAAVVDTSGGGSAAAAPANSVAPATLGSSVPAISSAAPAASAAPGGAASASATQRTGVPGGAASPATRPAGRGEDPRGGAAALMTTSSGAAKPAPSLAPAVAPKSVPSAH